jgi:hypothetical protein
MIVALAGGNDGREHGTPYFKAFRTNKNPFLAASSI